MECFPVFMKIALKINMLRKYLNGNYFFYLFSCFVVFIRKYVIFIWKRYVEVNLIKLLIRVLRKPSHRNVCWQVPVIPELWRLR